MKKIVITGASRGIGLFLATKLQDEGFHVIGIARNFLKVVSMAKGEFTWLIGDDDLLLPNTLLTLEVLFKNHKNVNFFYINSYLLHTDYVFSFPQPFDISKLPSKMDKFSSYK